MAKFRKKSIFIVILALCLALCLTLVACNDDNNKPANTAKYSVTVKIGDTPQANVTVTLAQGGVEVDETTGADGKASFELAKGTYTVSLSDLPEHYVVPENATLTLTEENPDAVITLEKAFAYVVKLVNLDGTPFVQDNVFVMACTFTNNCHDGVDIDENGVAYLYETKGNYHVKVEGLKGYAYECDEDGYYIGQNLSETVTEMTITLYPVQEIDFSGDPIDDYAEKETYGIDYDVPAYKFTTELQAGETVIYTITLPAGQYGIYKNVPANVSLFYSENAFKKGAAAMLPNELTPTKPSVYYIQITNSNDVATTADIIISTPKTTITMVDGINPPDTTVTVSKATDYATITFVPNHGGKYVITSKGETETFIAYSTNYQLETEMSGMSDASNYSANYSIELKFTDNQIASNVPLQIGIAIKAELYPASVAIEIKQALSIDDNNYDAEVSETLTAQTVPNNKELEKLPMTWDILDSMELKEDGFYHYTDEDENDNIVYVVLTKPLELLTQEGSLAYLDKEVTENFFDQFVFDITSPEDKANLTKGDTIVDYRLFLRGFKDYDVKYQGPFTRYSIPDELEEANCYANYVNADGAYPLNDELITFLKAFYEATYDPMAYVPMVDVDEADFGCEWMFALYYYVDYVEPDAIVGTYKFVSVTNIDGKTQVGDEKEIGYDFENYQPIMGTVGDDEYKLVITKRGKFNIYRLSGEDEYNLEDSGKWEKNGATYSFTVPGGLWDNLNFNYVDLTYTTVEFNATTGALKLTYTADPDNEDDYDRVWEFVMVQNSQSNN